MKKTILILTALFLASVVSFGQTRKAPVKPVPVKPAPTPTVAQISDTEWNEMVKALTAENWVKASSLISVSLSKLKTDNETKQLARLRYFYLYSLAGKVAKGLATFEELEKSAKNLIGQDFLMPSREIAADCTKKLNYICAVKDNEKALRVTAINEPATSILSFEYVLLNEQFDVTANNGKKAFLSGRLKKTEFNPEKSDEWIMRLFFENGAAAIVAEK